MTRERRRIIVAIRRGDQPAYRYEYLRQPIRAAKAQRLLAEAVNDTASNISRGWKNPVAIRDYAHGASIRSGIVRASVRIQPA